MFLNRKSEILVKVMKLTERNEEGEILERPTTSELDRNMDLSEEYIRRNVVELEESGYIEREEGGNKKPIELTGLGREALDYILKLRHLESAKNE